MTSEEFHTYRRKQQMTQGDMAIALGVSRITINAWENDRTRLPRDIVARLATIAPMATATEQRKIIADDIAWYRQWRAARFDHVHVMAQRKSPALHPDAVAALRQDYPIDFALDDAFMWLA